MVIILPRVKSGSERMSEAFHKTGTSIAETLENKREKRKLREDEDKENEALEKEFDINFKGYSPEIKKLIVSEQLKGREISRKKSEENRINQEKLDAIEEHRGFEKGSLKGDSTLQEKLTRPIKEEGGVTAKPVPEKYREPINEVLDSNPNADADTLTRKFKDAGIPAIWSKDYIENRRESSKIPQAISLEEQKLALHRDDNLIKEFEGIRKTLPQLEADLSTIYDSFYSGDQSFFSLNNLAEMSGMELWRDAAGGQFKSGIKNFLVNTVQSLGGRPNQWIEQQMYDAFPKVGRTRSANLMAAETMRFKSLLDRKAVETFDKVSQEPRKPGELGGKIARELADFVDEQQKNLQKRFKVIKKFESQLDAMPVGMIPMVDEEYSEIFFVPQDDVEEGFIMGFSLL